MLKVLRLGHRQVRDKRITTHVALAARALGADEFILSGEEDQKILKSIRDVSDRFGGSFTSKYEGEYREVIKNFPGKVIHLTMYGENVKDKIGEIKDSEDVLVVLGGKKVPREVYEMSDYNISVTNQPHSEVSSLAIFLDRYHEGRELDFDFEGGEIEVVPSESGKDVRNK